MKNFSYCFVLIAFVGFIVGTICGDIPTTITNNVGKCMEVGGYCTNHWDCCSKSCLSFSYKCVRSSLSSSVAPLDPEHVNVDTVEELINRFGGGDDNKTITTLTTIETTTTTATPTSTSSIINNNANKTECIGIGYECADSGQCCSDDCLHFLNINICIQKRTTTDAPPECLNIGKKCYRNEECCTIRCHGYLHQCVT